MVIKMSIYLYFILFMIYSFIGWIMEMVYNVITDKKVVNRGFLMGPYCPIYGCGAMLMVLLLNKYSKDIIILFIMAIVIFSILEYTTSYLMEKIFKARWWDYSKKKFNINGRICLETMVPFGVLGVLLMRFINPFFVSRISKIPNNVAIIIAVCLLIVFTIDIIMSYSIISKIKTSAKRVIKDNTEEITKNVREYVSNYSKFGKRLILSFPNVKVLKDKYLKKKK